MTPRRASWRRLAARFDDLVATFGPEHLSPDPLEVVRRHRDPGDVEVVGFLAAALAFGSARGAVRSVEALLVRVTAAPGTGPGDGVRRAPVPGEAFPAETVSAETVSAETVPGRAAVSPVAAVRAWPDDVAEGARRLRGWRHRWLGPSDAAAALAILGRILRSDGSIERFFAAGDPGVGTVRDALASFSARALALAPPGSPARTAYWFSGPASGGASKRLCLFLRWMCRRDQMDPGPWTSVDPSRLVVPLDTHVARLARFTGLLRRATSDWNAAEEVTAALRRFDAADPVKYDYALCRLGILKMCPRKRQARTCAACPLFEVCLL